MTWFLSLFNIFTINIPQWVYFQYLVLYNNWLNWWYKTVNIKSLDVFSLPGFSKINTKENIEQVNPKIEDSDKDNNRLIVNKKRFYIFVGIITLIGIGVSYYYYSDFGGSTPPDISHGDNSQIEVTDNSRPESSSRSKGKGKLKAKIQRTL